MKKKKGGGVLVRVSASYFLDPRGKKEKGKKKSRRSALFELALHPPANREEIKEKRGKTRSLLAEPE